MCGTLVWWLKLARVSHVETRKGFDCGGSQGFLAMALKARR
jgi:hypothetical protein